MFYGKVMQLVNVYGRECLAIKKQNGEKAYVIE